MIPRMFRGHIVLALMPGVLAAVPAGADIIDFESIPGGTPSEGLPISDQFAHAEGQRPVFLLTNGVPPRLGAYGAPRIAFNGYGDSPDQPAPGQEVGGFFLTNYAATGGPQAGLVISFMSPVARVSGDLIDIDQRDEWTIQALDQGNSMVGSLSITAHPLGGGYASAWELEAPTAIIRSVRIVFSGLAPLGVGMALDNLAFTTLPCRADINFDGFLDGADYDLFTTFFASGSRRADYNGDGFVDGIDMDQFNNNFESGC